MSLFARVVFVLLVAATFSAFFAAQRLKSAPPVATIKKVTQHFSPNGDGRRDVARFRVRVRKDDDVTMTVVDDAGTEVRRLATAVPAQSERAVRVRWDGRTENGATAPEGIYRLRVSLRRGGRAVTLNPGFVLDVTAPRPTVIAGGPDGTHWITGPVAGAVPFRVRVVSERFPTRMSVLRTDLGDPREVERFRLPPGVREGEWDGRAGGAPAPPGTYQIVAAVRDQAGNVGPLRAGRAGRGARRARRQRAGAARAPAGRSGARGRQGQVRGRLAWSARTAGGSSASARTSSRSCGAAARAARGAMSRRCAGASRRAGSSPCARRAGRPACTCCACAPASTSPRSRSRSRASRPRRSSSCCRRSRGSGGTCSTTTATAFPNTLENGSSAAYPRLLAGGLPAGFGDDVGALLGFLDAQRIHYDVTTDLTLAASRSGLTGEREGVILAGPFRWVSTELARRLRRYASEGGRVASFGAESLRRGVDIARDRLLRPLPHGDTDPFGTHLRPVRRLPAPAALQPIADEGDTGLLTGVESLPGFSELEESEPSDRVQVALAAVDLKALEQADSTDEPLPDAFPAVSLSSLGEGTVIRVGLPQWGAQLRAGSVPVQQLTRNIADILRGAEPEIRSF